MKTSEVEELAQIFAKYRELGPNARRVAQALLDRLVKGKEHGDFDKPHNWDKESAEEALDLAVYQAAKLLGLGGKPPRTQEDLTQDDFVDADGRTPDGKPWVPPVGARVRVVDYLADFSRFGGLLDRTYIVKGSHKNDKYSEFTNLSLGGLDSDMLVAVRVVPA